jgi:hypothetical protein
MTEETVSDVVRVETARQTVILVFGVAGVIAMGLAGYYVNDQAAWNELQMRGYLKAKEYANRRVDYWANKSALFSSKYLKLRA